MMNTEAHYRTAMEQGAVEGRLAAARALAGLLQAQGRWAEAGSALQSALALAPERADLHNELANQFLRQGMLDRAIASYRDAIALWPGFAEAIYNLGNALRDSGDRAGAAEAFAQAIKLRPALAEAHNNLGNLRYDEGQFAAAAEHYRRAVAVKTAFPDAHFNLGNALKGLEQYEAALASYAEVSRTSPNHAGAYNNAGEVLERLNRVAEAENCYTRAIALDPNLPEPYLNLGQILARQNRLADGLAAFERAVALRPGWAQALAGFVHAKLHACDWAGLDDIVRRLSEAARRGGVVSPFIMSTLPLPNGEQTDAARRWAATRNVPAERRLPARERRPKDKICIGYLSGDFHSHATAFLVAELFELHDRAAFDVRAYSFGPDDGSAMRGRLIAAFDSFVDLRGLDDRQAAELLREDEVDILVDLKGYTQDARTRILAYRPAPLQVNWLGFPGSMGADFIDYVLADRIVAPESFQADCVERIVRLPDSFQPNDRRRPRPLTIPSRAACGLPEEGFVFCSFNNSYKISAPMFERWMRLLRRIPGSILWLLEANDLVATNLRREAAGRGVDPDRLIFAPRLPLASHINRLAAADLFLDTLPVNALTTASDALWAGLPVVTCLGDTVAGRGCASLLHAVGCPELVTDSGDRYEGLALRLAADCNALENLRAKLQRNRDVAPLFDSIRFTHNLEKAYRFMWSAWLGGRPAELFAV